jgi:hypothetical protein
MYSDCFSGSAPFPSRQFEVDAGPDAVNVSSQVAIPERCSKHHRRVIGGCDKLGVAFCEMDQDSVATLKAQKQFIMGVLPSILDRYFDNVSQDAEATACRAGPDEWRDEGCGWFCAVTPRYRTNQLAMLEYARGCSQ